MEHLQTNDDDNAIILSALKEQVEHKLQELRKLQDLLSRRECKTTQPESKTVKKRQSFRVKIKECIACSSKPITCVEIGNQLGGKDIPKTDLDRRKKHFSNVYSHVNNLFNDGELERTRIAGVYAYNKKL